jgi:hypothetical protein
MVLTTGRGAIGRARRVGDQEVWKANCDYESQNNVQNPASLTERSANLLYPARIMVRLQAATVNRCIPYTFQYPGALRNQYW